MGLVVLGFGAASAFGARLPQADRAELVAHGLAPMAAGAVYDVPTASLETDPVNVTIGSVTYQMSVAADATPGTGGGPPLLDITLSRSQGGKLFADQSHDYAFSPSSGLTFTYDDKKGTSATVKATTAVAPSGFSFTYTASTNSEEPCKLQDGSKGDQIYSSGSISVSTFKLVSGTTPFFGTVTTKPKTATFFYDPGCKSQGGGKGAAICEGTEDIEAGIPSGGQMFFANDYGDPNAIEGVFTGSGTASESIQHSILAEVKGTDLPAPTVSDTGATATVKTTGNPFVTGTAAFTSTKAPKLKKGSCKDDNNVSHNYSLSTYSGKLASGSTPFSANYDTGPLELSSPVAAKLYFIDYTS